MIICKSNYNFQLQLVTSQLAYHYNYN